MQLWTHGWQSGPTDKKDGIRAIAVNSGGTSQWRYSTKTRQRNSSVVSSITFTALFDNNEFNINRGKSYYLKTQSLGWGIAANFGKTKVEFTGISGRTQQPESDA